MRIASPLLKSVLYPSLAAVGVFRRSSAKGLAVVTYHGVLPPGYKAVDAALDGNLVAVETFRRHLRLLMTNYDVIFPEDILAWRRGKIILPKKAVLLTCDDGLCNNLTEMLPVLQQEGLRCLFFVTGASAEQVRTMLWYEKLFLLFLRARTGPFAISGGGFKLQGEPQSPEQRRSQYRDAVKRLTTLDPERRRSFLCAAGKELGVDVAKEIAEEPARRRFCLMTLPELRQLAAAGMTIGAHTMSHPILSRLQPESAQAEIVESRARLAAALQTPIWAFAYPFGDPGSVTPEVLAMPEAAGYDAAFLNFGGGLGTSLPPFAMPRIHVTADMKLSEFEAHVSGFYAKWHRTAPILEGKSVNSTNVGG
jgi:peptidoglycan/xylan/chitin deacetylase (PgdA/CDA1 family)